VRAERADVEFIIVGDGPLRADVEAHARRLAISEHVHFVGEVHDVRALLGSFDVFVLSSVIEGMPNVLLEALAAEKPAVVTAAGGMPEIVTHEETGLLVPPGDPEALAAGVLRLLARPEEGTRLGRAGRRLVEERYTNASMVARYVTLYEELAIARGLRLAAPAPDVAEEQRIRGVAASH
jgi:glycosyltransferase involved in cell wall biosynthesis